MKLRGMGDVIAGVTKATGLKKLTEIVVEWAGLPGCGCESRQEYLNKAFSFNNNYKIKVLKEFEYDEEKFYPGEVYKVDKNHILYHPLLDLIKDEMIEEI